MLISLSTSIVVQSDFIIDIQASGNGSAVVLWTGSDTRTVTVEGLTPKELYDKLQRVAQPSFLRSSHTRIA